MMKDRSLITHLCALSVCTIRLEIDQGRIHARITDIKPRPNEKSIVQSITRTDSIDLIHFVFHRERLGVYLSALFFEWKDTIELMDEYLRAQHSAEKSQLTLYKKTISHLYIVEQRYRSIINAHFDNDICCGIILPMIERALELSRPQNAPLLTDLE